MSDRCAARHRHCVCVELVEHDVGAAPVPHRCVCGGRWWWSSADRDGVVVVTVLGAGAPDG